MELPPWCLVFSIWRSIDFDGLDIIAGEIYGNVECAWEERVVKLLVQVGKHILLFRRTQVVESRDLNELLASGRVKLVRYANYGSAD